MVIAICDDEKVLADNLKTLIEKKLTANSEQIIYKLYYDGESLFEEINDIDILFLDIEMSGINGIDIKNKIVQLKMNTKIVFVSGHEEMLLDAFGPNVYSFLLKPIDEGKLGIVLDKLIADIKLDNIIIFDIHNTYQVINPSQIHYIKAQDKYSLVDLGEKELVVRLSLNEWEEKLPSNLFVRVNRFYIVAFKYFNMINDTIVLESKNEKTKISRKNKKHILEKYRQYLSEL